MKEKEGGGGTKKRDASPGPAPQMTAQYQESTETDAKQPKRMNAMDALLLEIDPSRAQPEKESPLDKLMRQAAEDDTKPRQVTLNPYLDPRIQ